MPLVFESETTGRDAASYAGACLVSATPGSCDGDMLARRIHAAPTPRTMWFFMIRSFFSIPEIEGERDGAVWWIYKKTGARRRLGAD
jgi:hypothetical protein